MGPWGPSPPTWAGGATWLGGGGAKLGHGIGSDCVIVRSRFSTQTWGRVSICRSSGASRAMTDVETGCAAKRQKKDGDVGGVGEGDDAMSVTTAGGATLSSASTSDVGSEASSMADAETALLSKLLDDSECPIDLDAFSSQSFERGMEAPADEAIKDESEIDRTSLSKNECRRRFYNGDENGLGHAVALGQALQRRPYARHAIR
jgi:hypothetical protein